MKPTETHVTVDDNLSVALDFFRWLSALIVVIGHSRAIFFVPWGEVQHHGIFATAFYFVSGWGNYGVLMFFAISGFLIGGGVLEKYKTNDFSFGQYFINRFTRIYIVLVPALLLVWLLNVIGLSWLNGTGIYTKGYPIGALGIDTRNSIGAANFIYNLLMLQNVLGPPFGTAQPLWSLNWEWWSYMLAPITIGLLLRIGGRWAFAIAAVAGVAVIAAGFHFVVLWHLGVLLALVRFRYRLGVVLFAAAACLAVPIATRANIVPASVASQLVFFFGFLLLLSQLRHVAFPAWWRGTNKYLAGFSYSLYVLHTTFIVFIMAGLQTYLSFPRQLQPNAGNVAKYLVLLAVVYVLASMFAHLTEYNTDRARKLIRKSAGAPPKTRRA